MTPTTPDPPEQIITLQLPDNFVGQLIDGLTVLIEQWEYTEQYLQTGLIRDDILARECHHPHEARALADYYQTIQSSIRTPWANQHP